MRIAITGATGGLGRNLVEHFVARGDEVTAMGRNEKIGAALVGARFCAGDLGDRNYVRKTLPGHDLVIHSAALTSPWGKWESFERSNVVGTKNVVESSSDARHFIHISTPSIYFSGLPQTSIQESMPLPPPTTHYARSKIIAEEIVRSSALPFSILRPRALFGPHDAVILPRIIRVMQRGFFLLPNGGEALTDVTYVGNVVHAVDLCEKIGPLRQAYNITNGEPLSVRELTKRVAATMSLNVKFVNVPIRSLLLIGRVLEFFATNVSLREPALTSYTVGLLGITQTLDISRARADLGYEPLISLDEGLAAYARWSQRAR